jgi:vacuolar-type H+-ATPase subunit F/Vma7
MPEETRKTRLLALGAAPLVEGFALIGFEAYPNATPTQLEQVLAELYRANATALVLVEHGLACQGGEWYARLRSEGGRIVITELPPLSAPDEYHPSVERLVTEILGEQALEARE